MQNNIGLHIRQNLSDLAFFDNLEYINNRYIFQPTTFMIQENVTLNSDNQFKIISDVNIASTSKNNVYKALWDTGATMSVITNNIVNSLSLKPYKSRIMTTGNGATKSVTTYLIGLTLSNHHNGAISLEVAAIPNRPEADIIIGMDVIQKGNFTIDFVDTTNATFTFKIDSIL